MNTLVRRVINFIFIGLIFWAASTFFPNAVSIDSNSTLILATALMFVMGLIFSFIFITSFALIPLGIGCLTTPFVLIIGLFFNPIRLLLLPHFLSGFQIHGFWTYVVLSIILWMFTSKKKIEKKED
jgi:hypothetical protein